MIYLIEKVHFNHKYVLEQAPNHPRVEGLRSAMMRVRQRTSIWCIRDALIKAWVEGRTAQARGSNSRWSGSLDEGCSTGRAGLTRLNGSPAASQCVLEYGSIGRADHARSSGFLEAQISRVLFYCGISLGFKGLVLGLLICARLYKGALEHH